MKIKTLKGYQDTQFVEVLEPLTLEDFIIEETAPLYNDRGAVITTLALQLKEEVAEHIDILLDSVYRYNKDDEDRKITKFYDHFRADVKFNGCKTQEQKDAKIEKIRQQEVVKMCDKKATRIQRLFERVLGDINRKIERVFNERYEEEIMRVMSGQRMSQEFKSEHLDSQAINDEISSIDEQIRALKEERSVLKSRQQAERNKNMLTYLEENGWNDDDEKVVIADHLRDRLKEMYTNGDAFKVKEGGFLAFN